MKGDIEEEKITSFGETQLALSKGIGIVQEEWCELEEIVPYTTESTPCVVESQTSNLVFVVFVSHQCISEVIAMRLDNLNFISEVVIKICVNVPVHTSILSSKPVRGPNIVYVSGGKIVIFEQVAGCPVNVARFKNPIKANW